MVLIQRIKDYCTATKYRLAIWSLRFYWVPKAEVESYRREVNSMMYAFEALALKELGKYAEMKAHCEAWSKAHPGNPDALLYLSIALKSLGQDEAALDALDKARRNPRFNNQYIRAQANSQ